MNCFCCFFLSVCFVLLVFNVKKQSKYYIKPTYCATKVALGIVQTTDFVGVDTLSTTQKRNENLKNEGLVLGAIASFGAAFTMILKDTFTAIPILGSGGGGVSKPIFLILALFVLGIVFVSLLTRKSKCSDIKK